MTCERIATQLMAYLDGRVTETERREVETHLEACAGCRTRAEEFGRVWRVLDEAPSVEPSLGFDARLRQRIAAEPKPRWFEGLVPAPRLVFAMTVLLAIAVWISATQAPNQEIAQNPVQEEEFEMIENLQVLENYEVLKTLAELPPAQPAPKREM